MAMKKDVLETWCSYNICQRGKLSHAKQGQLAYIFLPIFQNDLQDFTAFIQHE